jgi:hypothetical protein
MTPTTAEPNCTARLALSMETPLRAAAWHRSTGFDKVPNPKYSGVSTIFSIQ